MQNKANKRKTNANQHGSGTGARAQILEPERIEAARSAARSIYSPILYVGFMYYMQDYCITCRSYCIIFRIIVLYLDLLYYIYIIVLYLTYCIIFNCLYYI